MLTQILQITIHTTKLLAFYSSYTIHVTNYDIIATNMKYSTALLAVASTMFPSIFAFPASVAARGFELPSCGATTCLDETNGFFNDCKPSDLGCLCSLDQAEIDRYISIVSPCVDNKIGRERCTDGGIYQYKDLFATVCAEERFGNKTVKFPAQASCT